MRTRGPKKPWGRPAGVSPPIWPRSTVCSRAAWSCATCAVGSPVAPARRTRRSSTVPTNQWTRTVDGKTVTRYLSDEQLAEYQPWFNNAQRLKDLTTKLKIASVHAVEQSEGWTTSTANPPAAAAKRRPPRQRES